ncbi:hypothetical protein [Staphylothermus hellenicus]|uniref:Uncharacterized protein n=1 Tax=Staphylothermus hellenicus (strain DSM 12710 / JCM 10830 / BK20S6-10-b1 / P8) TaxID=591019 RepID=D7DBQ9_STAHD|nr:hypothetical protein [Staphylothermus hellenicus]ADI31606.1 hypothetical protein Shell_0475 [Staphylothermus hellenicus DSM 12710]
MLSNKISILLFLGIILALIPIGAVQPVVSGEDLSYYVKYLFTLDIFTNVNFSMHTEMIILYNSTMASQDTIHVTISIEKISASLVSGTSTTTTTISPSGSGGETEKLEYSVDIGLDNHYKSSFSGGEALRTVSTITNIPLSGMTAYYNISYLGMDTYNGLPVYKYKVSMNTSDQDRIFEAEGETYLHIGTLQPLYMYLNMNIEGADSSGTLTYKLETLETNLPAKATGLEEDLGKAEILAGGLPGANIVVKGQKGSTTINVTNNGDSPGYLILIYKNKELSLSTIPVEQKSPYNILAVKPGESKTIDLGFILDKDIHIATEQISPSIDWGIIILLSIVAALVAGVIYALHRSVNKLKKLKSMTNEGTPPSEIPTQ